jgi:hypothetical protein
MLVRTEHEFAYERMFKTTVRLAERFFGVQLEVGFGSLGHASHIIAQFGPELNFWTAGLASLARHENA